MPGRVGRSRVLVVGASCGLLFPSQQIIETGLESRFHTNDGPAEKRDGWQRAVPLRPGRINGHVVPQNARAETGRSVPGRRINLQSLPQGLGHKMLAIPVLKSPWVLDARQCESCGRHPIGYQDRFPDDEEPNFRVRNRFDDLLDCGGPPQADRSSGREKSENADRVRTFIESFPELIEVLRREVRERRLLRWGLSRAAKVQDEANERRSRDAEDEEFPFHL